MRETIAEAVNAKRIANAAPKVPRYGASRKKAKRNVDNCRTPIITKFLGFIKLFNLVIPFTVIAKGKIPVASTKSIGAPTSYLEFTSDNTRSGDTSINVITGVIILKLILKLAEDKSFLDAEKAGNTMKAILVAKLPTTMLIIRVM
jgi:hypothetical protein